ncbi:mammalian cell entry protein [Nocardia mangyaensis]|uniref:Mammalian cell entry protein n=1 Tax=Nocardia mangyaensis TaxID=2213200 RepID=A0A1J0VYJ7_9NOCA|nr:MCE family protein [Nocardia mangyaensis]APE37073.1 mammalian cell entry protein [Nocardia mangyaensis]
MKSFFDRDPIRLGWIGTGVLVALLVLVFNYQSIPGWPGSSSYVVEFTDASGLQPGDTVQITGITVGKVTSIQLVGDHVDVEVHADTRDRRLGDRTGAAIKVETVLGRRFVELRPDGGGELGDRIPVSRTTSGYDITDSLSQLTGKLEGTDKKKLSDALDSISTVTENLPENLQSAFDGISRASATVADRDQAVRDLFTETSAVSEILADRNQNLTALISDGGTLFAALNDRAATIRSLLFTVTQVSNELRGLVADNAATTPPALAELEKLIALLNENHANINDAISGLRPFATQLGEVVGSGPFFSALLHNITPVNLHGQGPGSLGGGR